MDPSHAAWTYEENTIFENALADLDHESPMFFETLAGIIRTKNVVEIETHYNVLKEEIEKIMSGAIELPDYNNINASQGNKYVAGPIVPKKSSHPQPSKKMAGKPREKWTNDEHEMFEKGLKKYGKGDWTSISREFVKTRRPEQVASHAQKYFLKLNKLSTSKAASTSTSTPMPMTTTPSPHLSGPNVAASMADQYVTTASHYYQHQS